MDIQKSYGKDCVSNVSQFIQMHQVKLEGLTEEIAKKRQPDKTSQTKKMVPLSMGKFS